MGAEPTRKAVARYAGVSESTVSYVVNNGPRPVAAETRRRVLDAIAALGYQPNAVAQSLRRQHTTIIGLIVPDTANPFYGQVARVVENACDDFGYAVMVCNTGGNQARAGRYLEQLAANRVAGIICIPTGDDRTTHETIALLCAQGAPAVVLDYASDALPAITADDVEMGWLATRHLLDLGHRRIGYVARDVHNSSKLSRYVGYQRALETAGIQLDEALVVAVGEHPEDGARAGEILLSQADRPTAIFAHNDMNAIGVMHAARARGLRLPDDLSVVGCDNIALGAYIAPPLTTVAYDIEALGRRAVEVLLAQIQNDDDDDSDFAGQLTATRLPAHLIVRGSTAPHRG